MKKKSVINYLVVLPVIMFFTACNSKETSNSVSISTASFEVKEFNAIIDEGLPGSDTLLMDLDYKDAFENGFVIPSVGQIKGGYFHFNFMIRNKSNKDDKFQYKIHYQNETYKFPEMNPDGKFNALANENFYGSWDDTTCGFRSTALIPADNNFHEVKDSFRIVGNPRFEKRYFENGVNQRWQRNPRVGVYAFSIIVATKHSFEQFPKGAVHFNVVENGSYLNPTFFYSQFSNKSESDVAFLSSNRCLKVTARPDPGAGVYTNPYYFPGVDISGHINSICGSDPSLYSNAAFEQFINNVDSSMRFENIPVVRDITADDYSIVDYNWDKAFHRRDETVSVLPGVAKYPCETVVSDPVRHAITIHNPGTREGIWRKESVGIRTRHGFTYGKYRMKCKLTELLNKNNIWNGITNAIWLLNQSGSDWNVRRSCDKGGYMATYWGGDNDKRVPLVTYSEIDFEILKATPYCPNYNFPPLVKNPMPDPHNSDKWNVGTSQDLKQYEDFITVACTNWDMACPQPENFDVGCSDINYKGVNYSSHRWSNNYRALSQKTYQPDNELFGSDFYYFEIDWSPTEVIWRIGPSPGKMLVVGYMNDRVTSIPNNQMTLIVTQEYHNTKWWPGSPFDQENLPFPSRDLVGEIYELVIE